MSSPLHRMDNENNYIFSYTILSCCRQSKILSALVVDAWMRGCVDACPKGTCLIVQGGGECVERKRTLRRAVRKPISLAYTLGSLDFIFRSILVDHDHYAANPNARESHPAAVFVGSRVVCFLNFRPSLRQYHLRRCRSA